MCVYVTNRAPSLPPGLQEYARRRERPHDGACLLLPACARSPVFRSKLPRTTCLYVHLQSGPDSVSGFAQLLHLLPGSGGARRADRTPAPTQHATGHGCSLRFPHSRRWARRAAGAWTCAGLSGRAVIPTSVGPLERGSLEESE
jgi:hypothetical protein